MITAAIRKLYKVKLLKPSGLYYLAGSVVYHGINLIALMRYAAKSYPQHIAITDDEASITYTGLYEQSVHIGQYLNDKFHLAHGSKAAILCCNHASMIRSVFAISQTGADLYLLNSDMSNAQFSDLALRYKFDLVVYDEALSGMIGNAAVDLNTILAYGCDSIDQLAKSAPHKIIRARKNKPGKIIVLTGGTTGDFKTADRKASMINYLNPFLDLIVQLNLESFKSVYIATPVYHGFGIAAVLMALMLGNRIFLTPGFDKQKACALVLEHQIQAVTLVPLMLNRMLHHAPGSLQSLNCIISGGAALDAKLVKDTTQKLGDILFNLYGTSEAGVAILATPADLKNAPATLGKKIRGVHINVLGKNNNELPHNEIGRICIKSNWVAGNNNSGYIETGDLGYINEDGHYFLRGKVDDMIVSGGENVYPVELEHILIQHTDIRQVAVIGVHDDLYGQRLKAYIVPDGNALLAKEDITHWLSTRVARYQMPAHIEFIEELPFTALGKPDKKVLMQLNAQ